VRPRSDQATFPLAKLPAVRRIEKAEVQPIGEDVTRVHFPELDLTFFLIHDKASANVSIGAFSRDPFAALPLDLAGKASAAIELASSSGMEGYNGAELAALLKLHEMASGESFSATRADLIVGVAPNKLDEGFEHLYRMMLPRKIATAAREDFEKQTSRPSSTQDPSNTFISRETVEFYHQTGKVAEWANDPRSLPTDEEVRRIRSALFGDPRKLVFIISSALSDNAIVEALKRNVARFGAIGPGKVDQESGPPVYTHGVFRHPFGEGEVSEVSLRWMIPLRGDSLHPGVIGGLNAIISERIAARWRADQRSSTAFAGFSEIPRVRQAMPWVWFKSAPGEVMAQIDAAWEEIAKLREVGPSDQEMARFRCTLPPPPVRERDRVQRIYRQLIANPRRPDQIRLDAVLPCNATREAVKALLFPVSREDLLGLVKDPSSTASPKSEARL